VIVNGSIWCQTLIVGSRNDEMIDGVAGSLVSMITPWESAAEYARVPSSENVMSCDSVGCSGSVISAMNVPFLPVPSGSSTS
jgi:hypothetical protein